jgi:hypothetical protein
VHRARFALCRAFSLLRYDNTARVIVGQRARLFVSGPHEVAVLLQSGLAGPIQGQAVQLNQALLLR